MLDQRFVSQKDVGILSRLAESMLRSGDVNSPLAEKLVNLLSNTIPLPQTCTRQDYVRLNSVVTYRTVGSFDYERVVIACPQDTDDVLAKVSILTPLAMALLGRPVGNIVEVIELLGHARHVEIVDVASIEAFHAGIPHAPKAATTTHAAGLVG